MSDTVTPQNTLYLDYFYSPKVRYTAETPNRAVMEALSRSYELQDTYLRELFAYSERLRDVPAECPNPLDPFWHNGWFTGMDAATLYCMLAKEAPELYLEVGSGNSTKFARKAITDHNLPTKIWSIDPEPRADINTLCDNVIRAPFESVDPAFFDDIPSGSVVFIDNSHRCFQNSDVTVSFLELLPSLRPNIIIGFHDIFLPADYPENWTMRWYNEQYMLAAFLLGGHKGFEVLLPVSFTFNYVTGPGTNAFISLGREYGISTSGGCFWMRSLPE